MGGGARGGARRALGGRGMTARKEAKRAEPRRAPKSASHPSVSSPGRKSAARLAARVPKVLVVVKRSNLMQLAEGHMDARVRKLLADGHETVKKWRPAHEAHMRTVDAVESALVRAGAAAVFLHGSYAEFDTRGAELVITVGGDGTLLAASHWVDDVPILGVNSAPGYSVGFFCGAARAGIARSIGLALERKLPAVSLARMAVSINGHVRSSRVLNEALFCHAAPAATSNYILVLGRRREEQRSSGLWVGTAAGSTGAMRSAGGRVLPLASRNLQLVVREPFTGGGAPYRLTHEVLGERAHVVLRSKMQSASVFLDGPYRELPVRLGDEVRFFPSDRPLSVLGLGPRRRS